MYSARDFVTVALRGCLQEFDGHRGVRDRPRRFVIDLVRRGITIFSNVLKERFEDLELFVLNLSKQPEFPVRRRRSRCHLHRVWICAFRDCLFRVSQPAANLLRYVNRQFRIDPALFLVQFPVQYKWQEVLTFTP